MPFPSPGDLRPTPETEPMSAALAGRFFTSEPPGKAPLFIYIYIYVCINTLYVSHIIYIHKLSHLAIHLNHHKSTILQ